MMGAHCSTIHVLAFDSMHSKSPPLNSLYCWSNSGWFRKKNLLLIDANATFTVKLILVSVKLILVFDTFWFASRSVHIHSFLHASGILFESAKALCCPWGGQEVLAWAAATQPAGVPGPAYLAFKLWTRSKLLWGQDIFFPQGHLKWLGWQWYALTVDLGCVVLNLANLRC